MKRIIILAVFLAGLTACSTATSTRSSAPTSSTPSTASAPSALPCNPQSSNCWLPDTAQYPQEEFISYKPTRSYPSAYALAKVLGCSIMPAIGNYTPSSTAVDCSSGPAAGATVSTFQDVAGVAANVQQNA